MGGANKIARATTSLVTIVGLWGVADLQAGAADEWRSRVSTKLLAIYDAPTASRQPTSHSETEPVSHATALEPHLNRARLGSGRRSLRLLATHADQGARIGGLVGQFVNQTRSSVRRRRLGGTRVTLGSCGSRWCYTRDGPFLRGVPPARGP
jgi:hypothetical protein